VIYIDIFHPSGTGECTRKIPKTNEQHLRLNGNVLNELIIHVSTLVALIIGRACEHKCEHFIVSWNEWGAIFLGLCLFGLNLSISIINWHDVVCSEVIKMTNSFDEASA